MSKAQAVPPAPPLAAPPAAPTSVPAGIAAPALGAGGSTAVAGGSGAASGGGGPTIVSKEFALGEPTLEGLVTMIGEIQQRATIATGAAAGREEKPTT